MKKLFKKQDEALVQYRFPEQAVFARVHLNACTLFGSPIRVNASSAFSVTLHPDPLSQDFSTSRLHRYQGGRHVKHMCAPSAVLHVSNIPAAITHAQIQTLFEPHGASFAPAPVPRPCVCVCAFARFSSCHGRVLLCVYMSLCARAP